MDAQSRRWYHGSRELWLWPIGPKGPTFVASSQPPLAAGRSSTSGLIANPRRKRTNRQQGTWGHFYISAVLHRSGQVRIRSQQSRDTSHTSHTSRIWKQVIDCIRWWDLGSGHKKSMPRFWGFHGVSWCFIWFCPRHREYMTWKSCGKSWSRRWWEDMEGWWQFGKPRFGGETWWSALMIVSLAMCWLTGMLYTDDMTIGDVVGAVLAALHINSILLVWSKAPQEGLWQDGCCDDASDCYLGTSKFCSLVHLDSHSLIAKSVSVRSICKCFVQFIFCVCAAFVRRWAQAWYSAHARKQTCKQLNFQP